MSRKSAIVFSACLSSLLGCALSYVTIQDGELLPRPLIALAKHAELDSRHGDAVVSRLENGVTLILDPVKGVRRIAMESIYDVGFIDEPKGMCQAAHLLEHLVCYCPTSSFRRGESLEQLNQIGMANAETLPDWTHYDYTFPNDRLEFALKIEAERLTSLQVDQETVLREVPRVYQETDTVERFPQAGLLKHAFMAFSQAWRNRESAALVRGGLAEIPLERLGEFHVASYRPDRLTLIIAGDFEIETVQRVVQQTVGQVKLLSEASRPAVAWEHLPADATVKWDTSLYATCLYYPPPSSAIGRIVLSHLGTQWMNNLANDPDLKTTTDMVMPSSLQWQVGELPFFVYAAAKPGVTLDRVEQLLKSRVQKFLETPPERSLLRLQSDAAMIAKQLRSGTGSQFESMTEMVMNQQKIDRTKAIDMVLCRSAISQRTLRQLGGDTADAGASHLKKLKLEEFKAIVDDAFQSGNQRVIRLVPQKAKS